MVCPVLDYFYGRAVFIRYLHDNFRSELHPFGSTVFGCSSRFHTAFPVFVKLAPADPGRTW